MVVEKYELDHIWPKTEGGPTENFNLRVLTQQENRSKGAEMPDVDDVQESYDPIALAVAIDYTSVTTGFHNPRNKNKGFGGLQKIGRAHV